MSKAPANGKKKLRALSSLRRKILLVDDDPVDLQFYGLILEHEGYQVTVSGSFEGAVQVLDQESFDMVVVGQGGPRFKGRSVVNRARQVDPQRPVAVIARHPDPGSYIEAMNLGAVDYREKTADAAEFVSVIEAYLGLAPPASWKGVTSTAR